MQNASGNGASGFITHAAHSFAIRTKQRQCWHRTFRTREFGAGVRVKSIAVALDASEAINALFFFWVNSH